MSDLKKQLKDADEAKQNELIENVIEQLKGGRYRKVEVQHDVVTILTQRNPKVNSRTRPIYQEFVSVVFSVAVKNADVMKKARNFAKDNHLFLQGC